MLEPITDAELREMLVDRRLAEQSGYKARLVKALQAANARLLELEHFKATHNTQGIHTIVMDDPSVDSLIDTLNARVAELEAELKIQKDAVTDYDQANLEWKKKYYPMEERAEKIKVENDLLQGALATREEELEGMSNYHIEVAAERDAALDAFRDYGDHSPGCYCRGGADVRGCSCNYEKVRKAVLLDD